ncbi:tetratricopeptide repeat protein [bacterium]|nr:tetratricopeptide repeat protein [bacterium]
MDEDLVILLKQAALQSALIDDMKEGNLRFITEVAMEKGAKAGLEYFNKLRDADMLWWFGLSSGQFRGRINSKGYELMSENKLEPALQVFKLNSMLFPNYWDVWDSLAECYLKMKKYDFAQKYYQRSLQLNPDNANAKKRLEEIKKRKNPPL